MEKQKESANIVNDIAQLEVVLPVINPVFYKVVFIV